MVKQILASLMLKINSIFIVTLLTSTLTQADPVKNSTHSGFFGKKGSESPKLVPGLSGCDRKTVQKQIEMMNRQRESMKLHQHSSANKNK